MQNSSSDDIVIDQLEISWQGLGSENLIEVQIGAGVIEWTGSAASGEIIDINDFTLANADGVVDLDYLDFDSSMDGAQINLKFILSDTSHLNASLAFELQTTPTPSPTPTPSYASCAEFCVANGYQDGNCRKNALECSKNAEVYQSAGDIYCPGAAAVDTCCCLP